ncbi:formate/nitrite transporter family protein [Bacillus sp. BRMEA1]|uniref:formate/nitrite transporter family protein n=1 Tax=Neobacillus endophyticus TaxID=2738405 RepID=UPI001565FECE|nr:formate/nitrite transporter family protein [Neobacillus endophyticus]NRD80953.1 formate/nitrite transporter family protein [Neobacillus endophyticus]
METKPLHEVEKLALKKLKVFQQSKIRYISRSMLASMFIGFGVIVAFRSGNFFFLVHSPFAYPIAAFTFGAAIILIAFGGGDLFTGNTFYYTYAALRSRMKWSQVFHLLLYSYIGNILGALAFAFFIYSTGLFEAPDSTSFLMTVVDHKLHAPILQLFFRGILCNWLVCLAFFIPMAFKESGAKMFSMMLFVFCFFISGYEHSIANMCSFAIALVHHHPGTISLAGIIRNLIPVTVGNLIGGEFMMGIMYYYANKPYFSQKEEE